MGVSSEKAQEKEAINIRLSFIRLGDFTHSQKEEFDSV